MGHEVIYYEVDVVSTERYSDDVDIWNSHSQLVIYKLCYQDKLFIRCRHLQCL